MRYVVKICHLVLQYFAQKCPQNAGTFQKILRRSIPTDPHPSKKKSEICQYKNVTSFLTDIQKFLDPPLILSIVRQGGQGQMGKYHRHIKVCAILQHVSHINPNPDSTTYGDLLSSVLVAC